MQPLRIAALQPSVSITLDRLGRLGLLVACTKYCMEAVPALRQMAVHVVHDSWSASTDELLAAKPDLVIASVPYRMESLAAVLKTGCTVLTFAPRSLADIYADTLLLGRIVDRASAALHLVEEMQRTIADVRRRAQQTQLGPNVYCEEWGKPLIHSQSWVAELVEAAGGHFIGKPGQTTDTGTVLSANPDVLLFAWCGAGDRVPLRKVIDQRGWSDMPAVRAGRVYCIPDDWLNTPAPTLMQGLRAIAAALHPELFGEMQLPRSIVAAAR